MFTTWINFDLINNNLKFDKMNEKQALEIIKSVLDLATSKGVFIKIDESYTAITAFNVIFSKLKDEQDNVKPKLKDEQDNAVAK